MDEAERGRAAVIVETEGPSITARPRRRLRDRSDRLKEEEESGITIKSASPTSGIEPSDDWLHRRAGHERFVQEHLAGVGGSTR